MTGFPKQKGLTSQRHSDINLQTFTTNDQPRLYSHTQGPVDLWEMETSEPHFLCWVGPQALGCRAGQIHTYQLWGSGQTSGTLCMGWGGCGCVPGLGHKPGPYIPPLNQCALQTCRVLAEHTSPGVCV